MLRNNKYLFPVSVALLITAMLCAIGFGQVPISLDEMFSALKKLFQGKGVYEMNIHEGTFLTIRLPRVLICAITGAILAVSGVLMQGLFRNPIVEPGLTGTSAGAAFGASFVFVLGSNINPHFKAALGPYLVPLFAFIGGLLATFLVYSVAKKSGKVSIISLLLVGMTVNAIGMSGVGFMSFIARDPQARSITFWGLGNFGAATWLQVCITGTVAAIIFILSFFFSKQLNALLLGEEEAGYLGVNTSSLKRTVLVLNTAMVSVATAFVGVISFVGLIVPHIIRILIGSDNKRLLPASMIGGALLLTLADMAARLLLSPAEIPVGIITSVVCGPAFVFLLKRFSSQKGGYNA